MKEGLRMNIKNVELEIKKLGINGEGIAYLNKKPVFIEGAFVSEKVLAYDVEDHGKYYKAKVSKILVQSKDRVKPVCKIYDRCQVCSLMPLKYEEQLQAKKDYLTEAVNKYAKINLKVDEILACENPLNYRNSIKLPFFNLKDKLAVGLHKRDTNHYIYLKDCIVQDVNINRIVQEILPILDKYRYRAYDKKTKLGLRYLLVRSFNDEVMVTFVVGKNTKLLDEVLDEIFNLKNVVSINVTTNTKNSNEFVVEPIQTIRGKKSINADYGDFEFKVSPVSFLQLNTKQAIRMYDKVKELLGSNNKTVLDLYCGVGSITNYVAGNTEKIVGIEINKNAIRDAKENAKKHRVNNAEFVAGDVEEVIKKYAKNKDIDAIIVDPPRVGLSEYTMESIIKSKTKKLIYISCNPSTLGKDLSILLQYYTIKHTTLVDMFAHTMHVESVMLLERK